MIVHRACHLVAVTLLSLWSLTIFAQTQTTPSPAGNKQQKQKGPEDTLRIETELVQIDVVVADKAGKLVHDLKREDFELFEDRKPQQVSWFSVGTAAHPAAWLKPEPRKSPKESAKESGATGSTATVEATAGRFIVLAVDDFHLAPANLLNTRRVLLRFIDQQMVSGDQVALATTSGALGLYQQFTAEREVLRRAINRLSVQERTVTSSGDIPHITPYQAELIEGNDRDALELPVQELVKRLGIDRRSAESEARAKARMIVAESVNFSVNTLSGIEGIVRSLSPLSGRKIVVLVSDGFLLGGAQGRQFDVRRITDAATRSGVVIYSIDARGLVASVPGGDASQSFGIENPPGVRDRIEQASIEAQRDALNALARDTGGFPIFNNNDLNLGLQKVLDDNEVYYVLAYEPEVSFRDGRFHKIEVRVKGRPELKVRTRDGYLAPDEKAERKSAEKAAKKAEQQKTRTPEQLETEAKAEKSAQIRTAIGSLFPLRGIPVELSASFIEAPETGPQAVILAQIDATRLQFEPNKDRYQAKVDVVLMIFDEKGKVAGDVVEHLEMNLRPESLEAVLRNGIRYNKIIQLKPGFYQVRLAVREDGATQLGSAVQWLEVPDISQKKLVLSSIFLSIDPRAVNQTIQSAQDSASNQVAAQQAAPRAAPASRRFKRGSGFDFTIFAYNPGSDAVGATDLVIQSQLFSGSKLVFASPLTKMTSQATASGSAAQSGSTVPYAARLSLAGFAPGNYELRLVVIDRVVKASTKRSLDFTVE